MYVVGQYEVREKEKKTTKVNAAYIRLMRYFMNIYIDIFVTFLEKLKVLLFLIIPTDSVKYLVKYFIISVGPT